MNCKWIGFCFRIGKWNTFNFFKKCVDLKTSMGTGQKVKMLHSTDWNCGYWTKQTDVDNCCYFNLKYYYDRFKFYLRIALISNLFDKSLTPFNYYIFSSSDLLTFAQTMLWSIYFLGTEVFSFKFALLCIYTSSGERKSVLIVLLWDWTSVDQ